MWDLIAWIKRVFYQKWARGSPCQTFYLYQQYNPLYFFWNNIWYLLLLIFWHFLDFQVSKYNLIVLNASVFSIFFKKIILLPSLLPASFVNESTWHKLFFPVFLSCFVLFFSVSSTVDFSHLLISLLLYRWISMLVIYLLDPLVSQI